MYYPSDMTDDDIMEFEYEYNKYLDEDRAEGQYWTLNAELQIVGDEVRHWDFLELIWEVVY